MELAFVGGWTVKGQLLEGVLKDKQLKLLRFKNCHVHRGDTVYYKPEWGTFDLALGEKICSVFGGPADRFAYGDLEHFENTRVPTYSPTEEQKKLFAFYQQIRSLRESKTSFNTKLKELMQTYHTHFSKHWLAGVELLELNYMLKQQKEPTTEELKKQLLSFSDTHNEKRPFIKNAIELIGKEYVNS